MKASRVLSVSLLFIGLSVAPAALAAEAQQQEAVEIEVPEEQIAEEEHLTPEVEVPNAVTTKRTVVPATTMKKPPFAALLVVLVASLAFSLGLGLYRRGASPVEKDTAQSKGVKGLTRGAKAVAVSGAVGAALLASVAYYLMTKSA
ncbi:hypothetical protein CSUI_002737 [Cystoisospora suis]|uniref:Transmembrane protein n=1 Tax=Cystoisospora suis TaxID=483139 RepID=A0A2C6L6V9_9APIC|nr:hypothetical protein CSUI_002737 [Cystoisospora suis]